MIESNIAAEKMTFQHEVVVRFQDCDPAGILFFARFFDLFHDAYAAFLDQCGLPLATMFREGSFFIPLVHAEADYKRPVRFGDKITVELFEAEPRGSSVRLAFRVRRPDQEIAAIGCTVHAFLDAQSHTKIELPPIARAVFDRLPTSAASHKA